MRRETWATGFDCGAGAPPPKDRTAGPVASASIWLNAWGSRPPPCAQRSKRDGKVNMIPTEDDRPARRADLQELEEVRGLIARGLQVGVLTYAEIAAATGE